MKSKLHPKVLGVVCATLLVGGLAGQGTASGAAESTRNDLGVGSFNVTGVHTDGSAAGDHRTWRERRPKVVAQILAAKLDVVGLQEANQSTIYKGSFTYGENQYLDLKGALRAAGGSNYALTNENAYNCVNPRSTYKCVYKNQGATSSNRILYNTNTVSVVRQGGHEFSAVTPGKPKRFLAWAVFKMKATGKQFLFTNTHLDPYSIAARTKQWDELIAKTNSLKGSLPVVAVGDYNTSKFSDYAPTYLPRMKANGYGDVVNQEAGRNTLRTRRAESVRRAWVNSFNGFRRNAAVYAYEDNRAKIGNGIDWIFATNSLRVKAWEVVVDLDDRTLQLRGVIPSDHALVRATLVLR